MSDQSVRRAPRVSPILQALIVTAVVTLYLFRASDTFVSDHATGDQRGYLGLALKLERFGLRDYNLFHVSRVSIPGGLEYVWTEERDAELLGAFRSEGIGFFANTVYHTPPLLAYLIAASHRVLAPEIGYQVLFPAAAQRMAVAERLKVQLYSSIVPLIFGVILVVATFLLARLVCGFWAAVMAALIVAWSPAVVFASERIWQDVPLAALITLTMLFLLQHLESGDPGSFWLAAVCYGLAMLMKNNAALLAPVLLTAIAGRSWRSGGGMKGLLRDGAPRAGLFLLLVAVLAFPWYFTAWRTWGTPFYNAGSKDIAQVHDWYQFLNQRPWYTYAVSIPAMMPLYLLGYARTVTLWKPGVRLAEVTLALWFLMLFVTLTVVTAVSEQLGPDSRYMLPAYPPLAILAASQLERLTAALAKRFPATAIRWAIVVVLVAVGAWSYRLTDLRYLDSSAIYQHFMNMPF